MPRTTVRIPTPSGDELEAWVYQPEGETDCPQPCVGIRPRASGRRTRHPRHGFGSEFEPLPFCTCVQGLDRTDAISVRQREAPGASESVAGTEPANRGNRACIELLVAN